jgi:hypothetical protein
MIILGIVLVTEVIVEVLGHQHRHEIGGRHGRRGMPGLGRTAGAYGVDTKLLRKLSPLLMLTHRRRPLSGARSHN